MYRQCQNVFPNYAEWLKPEKMEARRAFIAKSISKEDAIVLAKLSEFMPDEWPLDLLGWMFCVTDPMQRQEIIKGYKEIIEGFNNGSIKKETVGVTHEKYSVVDPNNLIGTFNDRVPEKSIEDGNTECGCGEEDCHTCGG